MPRPGLVSLVGSGGPTVLGTVRTTDATPATVGSLIAIPPSAVLSLYVYFLAIRADKLAAFAGEHARQLLTDATATATPLAAGVTIVSGNTLGGGSVAIAGGGAGFIRFVATGIAATVIDWTAYYELFTFRGS